MGRSALLGGDELAPAPVSARSRRSTVVGVALGRLLLLSLLWIALNGSDQGGLVVGALAVPLALVASLRLAPPSEHHVRVIPMVRFLPRLLWMSLIGSVDVAHRALRPRMRVTPGTLDVSLRLESRQARLFLASIVSLVPGSVSIAVDADSMRLHLLDASPSGRERARAEVRKLERQVVAIFGDAVRNEEDADG